MTLEPEFHHLAQREVSRIYAWYRARSQRASAQFLRNLDHAIQRVMNDPESFPGIGRGYRFLKVGKFPYVMVFLVRGTAPVFIIAVAHTSRRTGYWRHRRP